MYNEKIRYVTLHVFAYASSKEVCAAVYAAVDQLRGKSQGLLTSKRRLSKKNLTIPGIELLPAYMAANLLSNAKVALRKYQIPNCYESSDSPTVLFWLQDNNVFKQFVSNRVQKIQAIEFPPVELHFNSRKFFRHWE